MLICMTSDVANLPEGPPIKITQGPENENSPLCRTVLAALTTVTNRIHICLTQSTEHGSISNRPNILNGESFKLA